jgi:1-acyl-sn-glycerol-3-phosphate acyltransferase
VRRNFEQTGISRPDPSAPVLRISDILRTPLPEAARIDRFLIRGGILLTRHLVVQMDGFDAIATTNDPFILVANHSQRLEAIMLPALIAFHRKGNFIEFLSDWNFHLIPGIGFLFRRARTIPVGIKPAKPKFLNYFKRFILRGEHGFTFAKTRLQAGGSIGIFPEGTVNRNPRELLRGQLGAARLAIETGVPLIPVGIRFPEHQNGNKIPDVAPLSIHIGTPIYPPKIERPERSDLLALHQTMMHQISILSHKHWHPQSSRRTSYDNFTK